jgi:hypothetical protein
MPGELSTGSGQAAIRIKKAIQVIRRKDSFEAILNDRTGLARAVANTGDEAIRHVLALHPRRPKPELGTKQQVA